MLMIVCENYVMVLGTTRTPPVFKVALTLNDAYGYRRSLKGYCQINRAKIMTILIEY